MIMTEEVILVIVVIQFVTMIVMMKTISAQRQRLNAHDLHLAAIDRTLKANGKVIDIVMAAQGWAVPNDPDDLG